jgi:hypothetical protein
VRSCILAIALVLATQVMLACSGSNGPTGPTEVVPKPFPVSEVSANPQPGSTLVAGSQTTFRVGASGGDSLGSALGVVLIREDGSAYLVGCSGWSGNNTTVMNVITEMRSAELYPNGVYAWAKGHTLDGEILSVTGVAPGGVCYFLADQQDSRSVLFERAKSRVKVLLGWKVE